MKISPDPVGFLENYLTGPASPTVELYFSNPCRDLISSGRIQEISPTVFMCGKTAIVFRHALGLKTAIDCERLVYVIDDDWRAGLRSNDLPLAYRAKLGLVEARTARRLESRAHVIVTSSQSLARMYRDRFPARRVEILLPAWPAPPPFKGDSDRLRIACLGSWSHSKDLSIVEETLLASLDRHSNLELIVSEAANPTRRLSQHKNVRVIKSMNWTEYKNWLRQQAFDIGVYPLRDTAFNRARSMNKLLEYAQAGAITLASEIWSPSEEHESEEFFMPVPNTSEHWCNALETVLTSCSLRRQIYEDLRQRIARLDIARNNRSRWASILGLEN